MTKQQEVDPSLENSGISAGCMRGKPMFEEYSVGEDDMTCIHRLAPGRLSPEQVYVRSMYLCSTQPCVSDGCQFTREALEQIAEKVVGLSVLTGHDRSSLPLARFFKASVVPRDTDERGHPVFFVRAWFYWLRETSGAKDLLLNIDGGIYREVSLAWRYDSWRCSICLSPYGQCGHRVGNAYQGQICFRQIERITEVLEGSLVYKSADRNTFLTGARDAPKTMEDEPILVIGDREDPLIHFLLHADASQEQRSLEELEDGFIQSVNCLWIRPTSREDIQRTSHRFLMEEGVCLGELCTSPAERNSPREEMLFLVRKDADIVSLSGELKREDEHASIRTL